MLSVSSRRTIISVPVQISTYRATKYINKKYGENKRIFSNLLKMSVSRIWSRNATCICQTNQCLTFMIKENMMQYVKHVLRTNTTNHIRRLYTQSINLSHNINTRTVIHHHTVFTIQYDTTMHNVR